MREPRRRRLCGCAVDCGRAWDHGVCEGHAVDGPAAVRSTAGGAWDHGVCEGPAVDAPAAVRSTVGARGIMVYARAPPSTPRRLCDRLRGHVGSRSTRGRRRRRPSGCAVDCGGAWDHGPCEAQRLRGRLRGHVGSRSTRGRRRRRPSGGAVDCGGAWDHGLCEAQRLRGRLRGPREGAAVDDRSTAGARGITVYARAPASTAQWLCGRL